MNERRPTWGGARARLARLRKGHAIAYEFTRDLAYNDDNPWPHQHWREKQERLGLDLPDDGWPFFRMGEFLFDGRYGPSEEECLEMGRNNARLLAQADD